MDHLFPYLSTTVESGEKTHIRSERVHKTNGPGEKTRLNGILNDNYEYRSTTRSPNKNKREQTEKRKIKKSRGETRATISHVAVHARLPGDTLSRGDGGRRKFNLRDAFFIKPRDRS